jgi:hypothetical protein
MPPKNPNGIAHHFEMGVRSATFFFVSTLIPLAPANTPRTISKGSLGALINKPIPITIPTKENGKSQSSSFLSASLEDFLPKYKEAQISIRTIMGTTVVNG